MSASKFGEGISLFERNEVQCRASKELMTIVAQLYTNRSLSWHQLGNQGDAIKDASYVLAHIDAQNTKALFRRAHGYKTQGEIEKAIKDLEVLVQVEPANPQAKKEMIELKAKVRSGEAPPTKVDKSAPAKSTPGASKIQDVDASAKEEELETSETPFEEKVVKKKSGHTKTLDQNTVEKAAEIATLKANEAALKSIPKTSAGLEKDYNQLKKSSDNVYQYVKQIPLKTLESLYKSSEIESGVFSGILAALTEHGLDDRESATHTGEFLFSLSKSSNFDMTLMFIDDGEKE